MADRDEGVLAKRLLEANKALAEAIRDGKDLAAMVKAERMAEDEQQRCAEEALRAGDEEAARTALETKRRRAKERARHEQLVARQKPLIARLRVAAAALREQLAELREQTEGDELDADHDPDRVFRRAAWLRLVGTLPERALAKAAAPLLQEEHALRDQLRDMMRIRIELARGHQTQRARVARRKELLTEAETEAASWKKRAALALKGRDEKSAKAFLVRHRTWAARVEERSQQLAELEQRLATYERASTALSDSLAQARLAVPHVMAGLSQ
jgi:phage shock protein A